MLFGRPNTVCGGERVAKDGAIKRLAIDDTTRGCGIQVGGVYTEIVPNSVALFHPPDGLHDNRVVGVVSGNRFPFALQNRGCETKLLGLLINQVCQGCGKRKVSVTHHKSSAAGQEVAEKGPLDRQSQLILSTVPPKEGACAAEPELELAQSIPKKQCLLLHVPFWRLE